MKNFLIIFIILYFTISCSIVRMAHHKVEVNEIPVKSFDCATSNEIHTDTLVEITSLDVKTCYLKNSDKILWLHFWVPDCGTNSLNSKLAAQYKEKLDLVAIGVIWDYENVRKDVNNTGHPVFYIDRSLPKNRRKSSREFLKQLLGENYSDDYLATNVFIKNGKIIHHCYQQQLNEQLLENLINN